MSSRKRTSITLWAMRVIIGVWLVQVLVQICLAAGFVTGNVGWFTMHSINGSAMAALPFTLAVLAVLHATVARGRVWLIALCTGLWLASFTQEVLGYTRAVGPHIVGGSIVLAYAVLTAVILWRHRYQPRPSRAERASA